MASLTLGSGRRQSGSRMPTTRPKVSVTGDKTKVRSRGVNDSGPESAPEYEFGSFLEIFDGDSGSGSFQVWSRFQAGIGSTTEADTKWPL